MIDIYNQGAGAKVFSYDKDNNCVVYSASNCPNDYEKKIEEIADSDKIVDIHAVSNDKDILIGNAYTATIDVADMEAWDTYGFNSAQPLLHETVEQYNLSGTLVEENRLQARQLQLFGKKRQLGRLQEALSFVVKESHQNALET